MGSLPVRLAHHRRQQVSAPRSGPCLAGERGQASRWTRDLGGSGVTGATVDTFGPGRPGRAGRGHRPLPGPRTWSEWLVRVTHRDTLSCGHSGTDEAKRLRSRRQQLGRINHDMMVKRPGGASNGICNASDFTSAESNPLLPPAPPPEESGMRLR